MNLRIFVFKLFLLICITKIDTVESVNYVKQTLILIVKKFEKLIEESSVDRECGKDLIKLMHDLLSRKKWAIHMIDASAKLEPGILVGNVNQIGNYDQCLDIEEETHNGSILGQYCTLMITPKSEAEMTTEIRGPLDPYWLTNFISNRALHFLKKNMNLVKFTYGVCTPKSCTADSLKSIWDYIDHSLSPAAKVEFNDMLCEYKGKPPFYIGVEPILLGGLGLYFCVILAATIYDLFIFKGDEESIESFVCTLSLRRNIQKLFATNVGSDNIACINGLKVLSMLWVIIGHRFLINAVTPNVNSLYLFEWKDNIENMTIVGASVSVDTFLTISGLLLSYVYLRYTKLKNLRINMTSFYLLRICRLTPPLLAVIIIYIAVLKYVSDGPLWPIISGKLASDCIYYGWTNLLFINNFVKITSQCLPQSWYLSVDSQLYFLFPLIFFSITKSPWKTLSSMLFVGILSCISSMLITMQYEYHSTIFDFRYNDDIYQSTFLRLPVWLIGVANGYFIFEYKETKFIIPRTIKILLWISTFIIMNCIVFGQIFVVKQENTFYSAIFNAFGRPIWALTINWIIFACITNNGGFVNTFLSTPVFNFVAKLTYSLYLIHFMVIFVMAGRRRHIDHFNNVRAIHEFCGDAVFSLVIGCCFSLLFESPVITFAKKFFRRFEEQLTDESVAVINYKIWFIPITFYTQKKID
ncbi:hypothetical protein WA026_019204 [Henosepilachna vigintioctopunctata]|uniref:Nose resistant-to-fluoxetine protein N-terminal domain-containing protein n=1 Tax=Henosepilachna vigintioctopunctata TaxID=420089 RepID=A0AAW1UU14_9CUCU